MAPSRRAKSPPSGLGPWTLWRQLAPDAGSTAHRQPQQLARPAQLELPRVAGRSQTTAEWFLGALQAGTQRCLQRGSTLRPSLDQSRGRVLRELRREDGNGEELRQQRQGDVGATHGGERRRMREPLGSVVRAKDEGSPVRQSEEVVPSLRQERGAGERVVEAEETRRRRRELSVCPPSLEEGGGVQQASAGGHAGSGGGSWGRAERGRRRPGTVLPRDTRHSHSATQPQRRGVDTEQTPDAGVPRLR